MTTPRKKRVELGRKGKELYDRYTDEGDLKPVLRFVNTQLRYNRGDVVRYLLNKIAPDETEQRDVLVSRILSSPSWNRYVEDLEEAA